MPKHLSPTCRALPAVVIAILAAADAWAQCPVTGLTAGLRFPLGITRSNQGNLLVAESGTRGVLNSGRISIVEPDGNRRTLVDGLPSGPNDVNDPSGPAGVIMRGRTLYAIIGIGNSILAGPLPRTGIANPNPSSNIFSSILAVHFSASVEKITTGFTLTAADELSLAAGQKVTLSNGGGEKIAIELIANLPDFTPNPLPTLPANVRGVNPFGLVVVADQIYVTDGGENLVWQIDIQTGAFSVLTSFPDIANPLFPSLGGPFLEAVPTGIREHHGQLLVTLFRGFPFPPGTSTVELIDPATGSRVPFITGLKTAIDVLPVSDEGATEYLVLQHALGTILSGPGLLTRFPSGSQPIVVANCFTRPTSMTRDKKTGALYITEPFTGRVTAIY